MAIPFFSEVISRDGVQPDLRKISTLTEIPAPKTKRSYKPF